MKKLLVFFIVLIVLQLVATTIEAGQQPPHYTDGTGRRAPKVQKVDTGGHSTEKMNNHPPPYPPSTTD